MPGINNPIGSVGGATDGSPSRRMIAICALIAVAAVIGVVIFFVRRDESADDAICADGQTHLSSHKEASGRTLYCYCDDGRYVCR